MLDTTQQAQSMFDRVQALYDAEIAADREAVTANDVPLSYEAMTDGWLTAGLCARTPGARVTGHRLGPLDDGTTNRRKIVIDYNDSGQAAALPTRLFCKASFGLSNRFTLGPCGALEAEVNFYNAVRPHLSIQAPEGVFAVINDAYNSVIMLRDMSDEVSEFCDETTVMTRARAESQIRLLAELHGRCASDPTLVRAQNQFKSWYDFFQSTKQFGLDLGAQGGFAASGDLIPERTHRRRDEVWQATEAAVALSDRRPRTITHGDVHLKNWYVAGDGAMGLSDWQCATVGHWGRDLAYAIGTALTIEDRRAWERDLIALYLDELAKHRGAATGFAEAWDVYREQMLPALAWWTVTINPAPGMPDMQPQKTSIEFVRRLGTAIDDLESLDCPTLRT